jgi:hypothetical protein
MSERITQTAWLPRARINAIVASSAAAESGAANKPAMMGKGENEPLANGTKALSAASFNALSCGATHEELLCGSSSGTSVKRVTSGSSLTPLRPF